MPSISASPFAAVPFYFFGYGATQPISTTVLPHTILRQVRYYGLFAVLFRFAAVMRNGPSSASLLPTANSLVLLPISELLEFMLLCSVQGDGCNSHSLWPILMTITPAVILQIRVHVMYQSRMLAVFNAVLFVIESVSLLAMWGWNGPFTACFILDVLFLQSSCTADSPNFYLPGGVFRMFLTFNANNECSDHL